MLVCDIGIYAERFGTVKDRDGNDETALHIAAKRGHGEIVKLLLEAKAEVNSDSGRTIGLMPLHLTIIGGHSEVVEILLRAGADVDAKGYYWGETPLLLAALFGRLGTLNILIAARANVSETIEECNYAVYDC